MNKLETEQLKGNMRKCLEHGPEADPMSRANGKVTKVKRLQSSEKKYTTEDGVSFAEHVHKSIENGQEFYMCRTGKESDFAMKTKPSIALSYRNDREYNTWNTWKNEKNEKVCSTC